jgi:hypothetical protein
MICQLFGVGLSMYKEITRGGRNLWYDFFSCTEIKIPQSRQCVTSNFLTAPTRNTKISRLCCLHVMTRVKILSMKT